MISCHREEDEQMNGVAL